MTSVTFAAVTVAAVRPLLDVFAVAATVLACWAAGAAALRPVRNRLAARPTPTTAPLSTGGSVAAAPARATVPELRVVEDLVAGLLLLHLLLQGLDLLAVPWHPLLLGAAALVAVIAYAAARRHGSRPGRATTVAAPRHALVPGAGDGLAVVAIVAFALASWFLRSPFSDFVYHWGLKAHRFFLHRGTDLELLARDANAYLHPDYPNLLPELFAVPAILSGRFFEPALLLLSALFLSLLALVLRAELRQALERRPAQQLAFAALVLGTTAFCIGYYQAGSADLPFAAAVLLGASALVEQRPAAAALRAGLAAAFAAALKIEGPPFAAILLVLLALRHRELWRRPWLLAMTAAPAALVLAPWAYLLARHDLYQPTNSAGLSTVFEATRLLTIAQHAWRVLVLEPWHGLPLLLLALPLLLLARRSRWLAALCGLQLAFYLYVYASAPLEPGFFVLSSFPRLVLHLMPAVGLAAFAALAPRFDGDPAPRDRGGA